LVDQVRTQLGEMGKAATPLTYNGFIRTTLGYPYEKHEYTTEDGYINSVMRIPGPTGYSSNNDGAKRPVVIYQHGLIDSGIGIIADGEDSLGIKLVNLGYDLWMNNARGSTYSKDHMYCDKIPCTLPTSYWDHSF